MTTDSKTQPQQLQHFIDAFRSGAGVFHEPKGATMPADFYGPVIRDFTDYSYAHGLVPKDYHLVEEAWVAALDKRAFIAACTSDDLRRLVGWHIRMDRFSEGTLGCAISDGTIGLILERLVSLES